MNDLHPSILSPCLFLMKQHVLLCPFTWPPQIGHPVKIECILPTSVRVKNPLQNGFWPSSTFVPTLKDQSLEDSTLHLEVAPFIKKRRDFLASSFQVGQNGFVGYFLAMRLVDGNLRYFGFLGQLQILITTLYTSILLSYNIRECIFQTHQS
jgi:hypothetical protein